VRVHQLLAALSYGDAIGNEALAIQRQLRAAARVGHLRGDRAPAGGAPRAAPVGVPRGVRPGHGLRLPLLDRQRGRRLIHHAPTAWSSSHNITPAHFFLGFHPHLAGLCTTAARARRLRPRAELGLGDSEFNRRELEEAGFLRTASCRIVLDLSLYGPPAVRWCAACTTTAGRTCSSWAGSSRTRGSTTSSAASPSSQSGCSPAAACARGDHRGFERYSTGCRSSVPRAACRRGGLHRPRGRRRAVRLLPGGGRLSLPLEHEGFCVPLQEANALRPARRRLRRGGRARDAAGRGRAAVGQEAGAGGGDPGPAHPRQRAAAGRARRPGAAVAEIRGTDFGAVLRERLAPVLGERGYRRGQGDRLPGALRDGQILRDSSSGNER